MIGVIYLFRLILFKKLLGLYEEYANDVGKLKVDTAKRKLMNNWSGCYVQANTF